jgi:hypothetical protein
MVVVSGGVSKNFSGYYPLSEDLKKEEGEI